MVTANKQEVSVMVDDLIDGMLKLMDSPDEFTGPVNLGNPHEISIIELANIIIKLTDSKSKVVFKPLPADDPIQRIPDIQIAKAELAWEPTVTLECGLKETIDYFRKFVT